MILSVMAKLFLLSKKYPPPLEKISLPTSPKKRFDNNLSTSFKRKDKIDLLKVTD
jgi:hypothetical protein